MTAFGRSPILRDQFDGAPTPSVADPPYTHHRDFYLATDGSFDEAAGRGGLGVVIETHDGIRVVRCARSTDVPDNNVAEYLALHLGLDVLATRAPPTARVGILVDHDTLASNVNRAMLGMEEPPGNGSPRIPPASENHWGGIRARLAGFRGVRAAVIRGDENPAHPLANAPDEYVHLRSAPDRCVLPKGATATADVSRSAATSPHADD